MLHFHGVISFLVLFKIYFHKCKSFETFKYFLLNSSDVQITLNDTDSIVGNHEHDILVFISFIVAVFVFFTREMKNEN